jgi:hypothetical protein
MNDDAYKIALRYSAEPRNESWYLKEMADLAYKTTGHTAEGQQHCGRLRRIANMLEALLGMDPYDRRHPPQEFARGGGWHRIKTEGTDVLWKCPTCKTEVWCGQEPRYTSHAVGCHLYSAFQPGGDA